MTSANRPTRNEQREAAREAAKAARERQKKRESRNRLLIRGGVTVGILAVAAIVAVAFVFANQPAGPGPTNMASGGIVLTGSDGTITAVTTPAPDGDAAPTPTDTTKLDRALNIEVYVDYLCPFCNQFETANSSQIEELVSSGEASYEIHPIAILDRLSNGTKYATRAANAAMCVANSSPDDYLAVNDALFANQPAENTDGLTDAQLLDLIRTAGVEVTDDITTCVNDHTYADWITADTKRVTTDADLVNPSTGSFGTPTIFVNGQRYNATDLSDANAFAGFIETVRGADTGSATPTPTPTPTPAN